MTDAEKKKYNQEHYLKNKETILNKAKTRYRSKNPPSQKIVPLFHTPKTEGSSNQVPIKRKPRRKIPWVTVFLCLLVGSMTSFLVSETAKFYSDNDGGSWVAYVKAFILEGVVFAFALMKGSTTALRVVYRLMIVLIFSYSIWVVSGSVVQKAIHQHNQVNQYEKRIQELETEIATKTNLRDSYFGANRVTLAMKLERKLDILQTKLEECRNILLQSPASPAILNTLLTLVVFRVLVMVSNLLCLKELGRLYRLKTRAV